MNTPHLTVLGSLAFLCALGCSGSDTTTGSGGAGGSQATMSNGPGPGGGPGAGGQSNGGAGGASGTSSGGGGAGGSVPESDIHFIGRFDTTDAAGPKFGWPGTAIATRFSGTGVTVRLADSGENYFAVVIDGGAPTEIHTTGGPTDYPLATGLADGQHDVWIEKRTESFQGTVQFISFTPDSGKPLVKTPPPYSRSIEFVGDSITCGYGNEGAGPGCGFTADTEDEYMAYGAIAARTVKAAHAGISYSGIGVYRDYGGSTTDQMPVKYERIFADDAGSVWDFSWKPDVVLVNLGTNDFAKGDPGQAYVDAYTAFAAQVRGHYPNALILCAVGSMLGGDDLTKATSYAHAVITARAQAGDSNMDFVDLGQQDGTNDGLGCDYHPTVATDTKMAAKLSAKLHALKGW